MTAPEETSIQTTRLTLVTIFAEHVLRERLLADLRRLGARGYSLGEVEGEGTRGTHAAAWQGKNLRIEVLVGPEVADTILTTLAETYFNEYAVVAFAVSVQVVRGGKFA
jgi:nitrogen regulatory protein P-II 2